MGLGHVEDQEAFSRDELALLIKVVKSLPQSSLKVNSREYMLLATELGLRVGKYNQVGQWVFLQIWQFV